MSGLAKMVVDSGIKVSGSDSGSSAEIQVLEDMGITIFKSHDEKNISKDIDLVVFSGAINATNPEIIRAKELGIEVVERSEFLGVVSQSYDKVVAIAGTHGKTTTTALIGEIFVKAEKNPTIHIGGESVSLKGNTIIGGSEYFIVEACEYRESFRYLRPHIGVITNIDLDHVDYYSGIGAIQSAFERFADNCGSIVCPRDITLKKSGTIINSADGWEARFIKGDTCGYLFAVYFKAHFWAEVRLNMIGLHNITNTLFAIAVAVECGIDKDTIVDAIAGFLGVGRRYEKIATCDGCNVIIDYAHHPTELKCSIEGISGAYSRVLYIFQPHTYSRTLGLFDEFVEVLSELNDLVLFKTYPAREDVIVGGTAMDLYHKLIAEKIDKTSIENRAIRYMDDIVDIEKYIRKKAGDFDCILVLGAGDLADKLKKRLKKEN